VRSGVLGGLSSLANAIESAGRQHGNQSRSPQFRRLGQRSSGRGGPVERSARRDRASLDSIHRMDMESGRGARRAALLYCHERFAAAVWSCGAIALDDRIADVSLWESRAAGPRPSSFCQSRIDCRRLAARSSTALVLNHQQRLAVEPSILSAGTIEGARRRRHDEDRDRGPSGSFPRRGRWPDDFIRGRIRGSTSTIRASRTERGLRQLTATDFQDRVRCAGSATDGQWITFLLAFDTGRPYRGSWKKSVHDGSEQTQGDR
jgi:hypothetical protein